MRLALSCALAILAFALPVHGQSGLVGPSPDVPPADDKTGTNPLNLQHQVDVVNTFIELESLFLNTTTYRHGLPLLDRRLRITGGVPIVLSNLTGGTEGGVGDVAADVEWLPWLGDRRGLVVGLRTTWSTATTDGLGYGAHTLMPYGQFVLQPSARTILAPFVAQRVSIGGDDFAPSYAETLIGARAVWRVRPRVWLSTQPQLVIDHEREETYGDVGGEVGWLLLDRLSTYVQPSVGFGLDGAKPYSWGVTFGFRVVP